jgi:hypothetical protein
MIIGLPTDTGRCIVVLSTGLALERVCRLSHDPIEAGSLLAMRSNGV